MDRRNDAVRPYLRQMFLTYKSMQNAEGNVERMHFGDPDKAVIQ
jgi:hypothetical protein